MANRPHAASPDSTGSVVSGSTPPSHGEDSFDDDDRYSTSSNGSKRRRRSGAFDSSFDLDVPSRRASPFPGCAPGRVTPLSDFSSHHVPPRSSPRILTADLASNMAKSTSAPYKGKQAVTADYEDWENLKELFSRAMDRYDADDITETLPLLRAVIRECHRFLKAHPDPSVIYTGSQHLRDSRSPEAMTPTDERLSRDWGHDSEFPSHVHEQRRRTHHEQPTAFHAIFGIALFLMGTIIAQDSTAALPGEPDTPSAYWLAALDVFETGENLPSRTCGNDARGAGFSDLAEDWRMAIVWGRTLVCLADEKVAYSIQLAKEQAASSSASNGNDCGAYCYLPSASPFPMTEPAWPADSPFAAIAAARPPVSRRMGLYSATAHDVMVLAMDQFSRGIFHMPHPHYPQSHNPASYAHIPASPHLRPRSRQTSMHSMSPPSQGHGDGQAPSDPFASFSRPRELFTIASEVLGVAERLPDGTQRAYWANWAESVFKQMKMEADMDAWRGPLTAARGRCWLVMGSAPVEELELALERGDTGVLGSAEAEEAREGLAMAVSFFERAKGAQGGGEDVGPLLAEALFTLANLTEDDNKREELYSRARREAGERLARELGLDHADDAMDES